MAEMMEEPHVVTGESGKDAGEAFFDSVLDRVEEFPSDMASMKAENMQVQEGYAKVKGELEDLNI